MGCLLCGKEIGPLRLLRDDEFCSNAHRNRYKERLGKALSSIGLPAPPPAPPAGFFTEVKPAEGNRRQAAVLFQFNSQSHVIGFQPRCPVNVDPVSGGSPKPLRDAGRSDRASAAAMATLPLMAPIRFPALSMWLAPEEKAAESPSTNMADTPVCAPAAALPPGPVESWIATADASRWIEPAVPLRLPFAARVVQDCQPPLGDSLRIPPAPVESWIATSEAARWIEAALPLHTPFSMTVLDDWQPAPCDALSFPAAPVESWIRTSAAVRWIDAVLPLQVPFAIVAAEDESVSEASWALMPAQPVESWITFSDAADWMWLAAGAPFLDRIATAVPQAARFAASPQPVEVMSFVEPASAREISARVAVENPRFEFDIWVDASGASAEEPIEVAALCEQWMRSPDAEAVASLVRWSEACAASFEIPVVAPCFSALEIAETFMPSSTRLARPAPAAPVAAFVYATHEGRAISPAPAILSAGNSISDPALKEGSYVAGPKPEPLESMPVPRVVTPAEHGIVAITAIRESLLPVAACTNETDPATDAPEPVEDLVFPSYRAAMLPTLGVVLPALRLDNAAERPAATFESRFDAKTLPAPWTQMAECKPALLEPIGRLVLARPEVDRPAAAVVMPGHGFISLVLHCQRPVPDLSGNFEWQAPMVELKALPFAVRPVFEKTEEAAPQKKEASKKPAMAEVFAMTRRTKAVNPAALYAFKAVAASLIVGAILWFGMGTVRIGSRTPAVNSDVSSILSTPESGPDNSAAGSTTSARRPPSAAVRTEPAGPVARIRRAIADRAAATVTDSFRNGMEAWGAGAKAWAPGWSRHPEGYVQPGQLAIFEPSLKYTDYHLEFFGQIDNKSLGWTVRSKDTRNYYAMKFSVVDPGLRPIIAMVHYPVVGGKKGKPVETPLNVMVHNNKPFQVAVDVRGNRMVTSIDGQEVDTWIDDTIPAGGVGFFADAGEKARLYWMKVSKNEDFLGRVCAYVSSKLGDGSNASAEVWGPGFPVEAPLPGSPMPAQSNEAAVAAAVLGFGRKRRNEAKVWMWRSKVWNS